MSGETLSGGGVVLSVLPDAKDFGSKLKASVLGGTAGVGESMGGMLRDGLSAMAGPVAAVAAGMSVEHIVEGSIHSFEDLATQVNSMKRVIGGSVEDVSALRGAFQLSGVDVDSATASVIKFEKGLSDTASGNAGAAATALAKIGIAAKDSSGQILPMTTLLPQVADKFESMPDGANKTALAMQLFGKSGAQMLPFLDKGASGIAELEGKAKSMGLTLDDAGIQKFKDSAKEQREFQATMQGLQVTLGQAFLPVLEGVQNAFREFFIPLIEKATEFVKDHEKQFEDLGNTLKSIVVPVLTLLMSAIEGLTSFIVDNISIIKALLIIVGVAVGAWQAYEIVMSAVTVAKTLMNGATVAQTIATQAGTAAQWLMNAALDANPIGIVVVAIGALVGALIWFFTQTTLGQAIWKGFVGFLSDSWNNIVSFFSTTFTNIASWFTTMWKNFQTGWGIFSGWIKDGLDKVGQFFSDAWDGIGKALSGAFKIAVDLVKGYIDTIIDAVNTAIGGINSLLGAIKTVSGGAINLKIPSIPKFADGGVVPATPGGRIVQVAEAGQAEAIIPLSKLGSVAGGSGKGTTIIYNAAPNDSITAEQKLVSAVQRAKVLGAMN